MDTLREAGTTIRNPSTANFVVDSSDRPGFPLAIANTYNNQSTNFTIQKNQSLFNGFFTRIAPTEVWLDYCLNNIAQYWKNTLFYVSLTQGPVFTYAIINLASGSYTTESALNSIVTLLNASAPVIAAGGTFSLTTGVTGLAQLHYEVGGNPTNFIISSTTGTGGQLKLYAQLNFLADTWGNDFPVRCPNLLPTRYIDFVSNQVTYNQDVKDGSTALKTQDFVYRWYMAWDVPAPEDGLGYPIYQGYERFISRRYNAFPKQIKWNPGQPIGQVQWSLYDDGGDLIDITGGGNPALSPGDLEWSMTMLVSEN